MTAKQVVQELLSGLPDDCTLEDIQYTIDTRRKVEEGLAALDRGEFHTHEEVCAMMDQWLAE